MADLVTRLRLDDHEFNNNIRRSQQEVQGFQKLSGSITSTIKGFGVQLMAAAGAMEVVNTAINSNATTQRLWNDTIGTAKESVDTFFTALTTGDWSVFENGILNAIKLSKNYVQSLRQIKSGLQFTDVKLSVGEKDMNYWENIASDTNRSDSEREAGFIQFKKVYEEHSAYVKETSDNAYKKLGEMLSDKGIDDVGDAEQLRSLILDYQNPLTSKNSVLEEYKKLVSGKNEALSKEKRIELQKHRSGDTAFSGNERVKAYTEQINKEYKQIDNLLKLYPELEKARKIDINFGTEEKMTELLDTLDKVVGYEDRLESMTAQHQGLSKDFNSDGKVVKEAADQIIPEGSIAEIEKRISEAKTKLNLAVDPESRIALENDIKQLEEKKRVIEFQYKHPDQPKHIDRDKTSFASMAKLPDMKKISFENPIDNKDVKTNNKYADSLLAISSIMGNVTNMTGEGAAAWISWGGNLLSAIAAAIPAITTLIGLKSTEAVVNGVASATQTPLVGWLLAGAAAASVIATIASIPAFADGGIFQSPFTTGDKNLARLNGGEMILNKGQQANLFNLLDHGGSVGGGRVEFKIKGKELVGVLSNYNNKTSKVR